MPSCTDPLRLNDNGLFKELRGALLKSEKETRNILEIRDDICYVWNPDRCCIFTLNVGDTRDKDIHTVRYQVSSITNYLLNCLITYRTVLCEIKYKSTTDIGCFI